MHVSLTGVNHQTAPVSVHEKIAILPESLSGALTKLSERLLFGWDKASNRCHSD